MSDQYDVIVSVTDLRERTKRGPIDAAILLAGGLAFSRKTIRRRGNLWFVKNHIDDTRQRLSDEQLWTESNIGEAIDKGALVLI